MTTILTLGEASVAQRIFGTADFVLIAVWWLASLGAAVLIANAGLDVILRTGLAIGLWGAAIGVPAWIARRHKRLDEMQQMILWRMLAAAGLFIISYLVAMACYFTLLGGGDTARGLLAMSAMAAPMTLMFAAVMAAIAERRATEGGEDVEA